MNLLAVKKSDKTRCPVRGTYHPNCVSAQGPSELNVHKVDKSPKQPFCQLLIVRVKCCLPPIERKLPVTVNFETQWQGALQTFNYLINLFDQVYFLGSQNYLVFLCIRAER